MTAPISVAPTISFPAAADTDISSSSSRWSMAATTVPATARLVSHTYRAKSGEEWESWKIVIGRAGERGSKVTHNTTPRRAMETTNDKHKDAYRGLKLFFLRHDSQRVTVLLDGVPLRWWW